MIIWIMQRSARLWTMVARKAIKIRALGMLRTAKRRQKCSRSRGNRNLRNRGKATVLVHASRNRGDLGWSGRIRGMGYWRWTTLMTGRR